MVFETLAQGSITQVNEVLRLPTTLVMNYLIFVNDKNRIDKDIHKKELARMKAKKGR